jgi:GNAT superfamily N-acetyltransferase
VLESAEATARWRRRLAHPFETDPGGSFVALEDGRIVGIAQAIQRERLWVLSTLAVDPRAQSAGVGRALLERALDYGAPAHGLIVSSNDARALRLYAQAGFTLLPTFHAHGPLRRDASPAPPDGLRELGPGQLERSRRSLASCAARRTPRSSSSHSRAVPGCSPSRDAALPSRRPARASGHLRHATATRRGRCFGMRSRWSARATGRACAG